MATQEHCLDMRMLLLMYSVGESLVWLARESYGTPLFLSSDQQTIVTQ